MILFQRVSSVGGAVAEAAHGFDVNHPGGTPDLLLSEPTSVEGAPFFPELRALSPHFLR